MSPKKGSSRNQAISRRLIKSALPKLAGKGDKTNRLNSILVNLAQKTEEQLDYWRVFEQDLVKQRESKRERILESLRTHAISGYANEQLVRIVDTRYQTRPLSSYGSIVVPPGGRFNFGEISSYHEKFQALYLASDFKTAASERFLRNQTHNNSVDTESLILRLDPNASFSTYRVRASNLTVIDITNPESLTSFVEIIAEIEPPSWLFNFAKKLKQPPPRTVKNKEELLVFLLDPNFTQYGSLIDQPSASQWFGYYVREAGIHGIIYSSVRSRGGFNLALFPDNFLESAAKIELVDPASGVRAEDAVLDGGNAFFQMQKSLETTKMGFH